MAYKVPHQVMFFDEMHDDSYYCAGIVYHDEVICACCGGVFPISRIYENAREFEERTQIKIEKPIIPIGWANFAESIADYESVPKIVDYEITAIASIKNEK